MKRRAWWVTAAWFTGLGWYVAVAILAPTLAGAWLDGRLGASPAFLLAGLALGLASAFWGGYRMTAGYLSGARAPNDDEQGES